MDNTQGETRPPVMDTLSETQLQELERNYDDGDQEGWMILARSYGWPDEQCKAVWDWFGKDLHSSDS